MFPTDYTIARRARAGAPRSAASSRSGSPSTRTSRPSRDDAVARAAATCRSEYWHTLDPFVALTAAAAATDELKLGTGICLVIERDPIITAKEVATSTTSRAAASCSASAPAGTREEMANHGTDPTTRFGADARARRGDEGDLDEGRGRVPRRVRRLRPDLVVAEAGAEAAPAGDHRRRRARRCSSGCSSTATAGCRSPGGCRTTSSWRAWRSFRAVPRGPGASSA